MDDLHTPGVPAWNRIFFGVVLGLAVAVAAIAVTRIVLLNQDAALIESVAADPNGDWLGRARSLADLESGFSWLSLILLIGLYMTVFVWIRQLTRTLGDGRWLVKLPAYIAWRVSVLALVVVAFALNAVVTAPGRGSPLTDFIGYDHRLMWIVGARIVLCAVCAWFAVALLRASNPRLTAAAPKLFDGPDSRPRTW